MLMKIKQLVLLLLISKIAFGQTTYIRFNEYSCSNYNTIADPLGVMGLPSYSPDWIEIRNFTGQHPGPSAQQQISGWYISDDSLNLHKWQIPYYTNKPIILDSGQVQVIFLCGHDQAVPGVVGIDTLTVGSPANTRVSLHANFQLNQTKKGGAVLYLTNSVNATVPTDIVHVKINQPGHSWGRCSEKRYPNIAGNPNQGYYNDLGNKKWRLYAKPTPGRYNPKYPFYYTDYLPKPQFDIKPGYYGTLNSIQMTDTSTLSSTSGGYVNYSSLYIVATNDCTPPDTVNSIAPGTATIVATGATLGTPLTGAYTINTTTLNPVPSGFMIHAVMYDASLQGPSTGTTVNTYSNTPRYLPSFASYGAYYDSLYKLPVVCVCIDTSGLFNTGAQDTSYSSIDYFDNTGKELWRNQGQTMINKLDFFNPLGPSFRKQWQFNFRAEDEYGYYYTNPYQFFQDPVYGTSKRADFPELIFRAGSEEGFINQNSVAGNGFPPAHVRDYFNHTMTMRHKLDFEQMHYTPVYMLINGANKGIYYIKEPFDSTYTDYYYAHPRAAILANGVVSGIGGTPTSATPFTVKPYAGFGSSTYNAVTQWNNFYSWAMLPSTNVHIPTLYQMISDELDFASLQDYTIYNMYSVNTDYLNRSAYWWKGLPDDTNDHRPSKWRCALSNTDDTWGFNVNNYNNILNSDANSSPCDFMQAFGFTWPFPDPPYTVPSGGSSAAYPLMTLWYKLMANDTFQNNFLTRYQDLLNSALSCDSLEDHFKYIRSTLPQTDMNSHVFQLLSDYTNFPTMDSLHYWNLALDSMQAFLTQRCTLVTEAIKNCFNLNGPYNLCVDVSPTGTGYVILNSLTLKNLIWNGKYMDSVLMTAKGIPNQNYVFDHWETTPSNYPISPDIKSDSMTFKVQKDVCIKAVFKLKPADQTYGEPMIPTGFSPNNDGNNDIFNIYGIAEASSYELEIYNRWGEMIFRSVDKSHGWDGTFNGTNVPVGVYAYRYNIMMNGKTYKSKGSVTLLR
jgi:gliding motility-associated-like protein